MIAILLKDIRSFFSSAIGYLVIAVFFLINGLFLWVFQGDFNIFNSGFAELSSFFRLAPWVLLFLVPAVTMRSIAEERKQGVIELLLTKPISTLQLTLGKFLGAFFLIVIAIIPTLLYICTISSLADTNSTLDIGVIGSSYFGMLLLAGVYTAIGLFASSITQNQLVAFVLAIALCFFMFYGFEGISNQWFSGAPITLDYFGLQNHYDSLGRGVLDTRDVVYFISIIVLFLVLCNTMVKRLTLEKNISLKHLKPLFLTLIALVIFNSISFSYFKRFDFTVDKRYTLSTASIAIADNAQAPLVIDVFLDGEFPAEFKRLQTETRSILEEFQAENPNIYFNFINPLEDDSDAEQVATQFYQMGMTPARVTVKENGKNEQRIIFPWAIANYNQKTVKIPLLKNNLGASTQDRINSSVQQLEYNFANAFSRLLTSKQKKIAIMRGNGELPDGNIADFLKELRQYYFIAPFTLDSVVTNPSKTLEKLSTYDLVIEAKPTEPFTEEEKYTLDQYLLQGGKLVWLTENVTIETDSLFNEEQTAYAIPKALNLDDYFFKYGIRIPSQLINDLYNAPLVLASGEGDDAQFNPYPWFYFPLTTSTNAHPIVNNIEAVKFEYANPIDTLKNNIKKTILFSSSPTTKLESAPRPISLKNLGQQPILETYNDGEQPMAVLLEGTFRSVYEHRLKPFTYSKNKDIGEPSAMVVISDGDVIKNKLSNNQPIPLGLEQLTGSTYGNKEFLLNAINYLLDDTGLIVIRSKTIDIAFLDPEKIVAQKTQWQVVNLVLPLVLLGLLALAFITYRKRKYTR